MITSALMEILAHFCGLALVKNFVSTIMCITKAFHYEHGTVESHIPPLLGIGALPRDAKY